MNNQNVQKTTVEKDSPTIYGPLKNAKRPWLSIGEAREVLRQYGCPVSLQRIRRFEDWGLINTPRSKRGYRCYGTSEMYDLLLVSSLHNLSVPVEDIRSLLAMPIGPDRAVRWSDQIELLTKEQKYNQKALDALKTHLKELKEAVDGNLKASKGQNGS